MNTAFRLISFTLLLTILATGCSPYDENPAEEGLITGELGGLKTRHTVSNKCGADLFIPMVFEVNSTEVQLAELEIVNDEDFLHFIVKPNSGLTVSEINIWRGTHSIFCNNNSFSGCDAPTDSSGALVPSLFPYQQQFGIQSLSQVYSIPLDQVYKSNSFVIHAKTVSLGQNGSIIFSQSVYAKANVQQGNPLKVDFVVSKCPGQACEPWIDGNPNCDTNACAIPVAAPGDNISAFKCTPGAVNSDYKICHIPPGNPSGMAATCIPESQLKLHLVSHKPNNNPCLGHHSGCHLGDCDPCGPGSTINLSAIPAAEFADANGCLNNGNGGGNGNGN